MSPHELSPLRAVFEPALRFLGWMKRVVVVHHEREWDTSWNEVRWYSAGGVFLFRESDLSRGLLDELVRLAAVPKKG